MVRAAVLKMKDPRQIIKDMEKLDEMGEGNDCCMLLLILLKISRIVLLRRELHN